MDFHCQLYSILIIEKGRTSRSQIHSQQVTSKLLMKYSIKKVISSCRWNCTAGVHVRTVHVTLWRSQVYESVMSCTAVQIVMYGFQQIVNGNHFRMPIPDRIIFVKRHFCNLHQICPQANIVWMSQTWCQNVRNIFGVWWQLMETEMRNTLSFRKTHTKNWFGQTIRNFLHRNRCEHIIKLETLLYSSTQRDIYCITNVHVHRPSFYYFRFFIIRLPAQSYINEFCAVHRKSATGPLTHSN